MATAYDAWKLDNGIDDAEEARDEWIAERANELMSEWARDMRRVDDALEIAMDDGNLPDIRAAIAIFHSVVEAKSGNDTHGLAAAAVELWRSLTPHVDAGMKDAAETEATDEYDRDATEDGSDAREAA